MQWFYVVFISIILTALIAGLLHWRPLKLGWRRAIAAWLIVSLSWIVGNLLGTTFNWWDYNSGYMLGVQVFGLPIEEVACLVFVPLAGIIVFYGLEASASSRRTVSAQAAQRLLLCAAGAIVFCMVAYVDRERTLFTAILALGTIVSLYKSSFIGHRIFWYWNGCIVVACFVFYAITAPAVLYNDMYATGVRIATVPLENFLYMGSLLNVLALLYWSRSLRSVYTLFLNQLPRIAPVRMPKVTQSATYHSKPSDAESETT